MLLARAERIRAGVSHKHVEPLSRQLADLQAQPLTLSAATALRDCPGGTEADFAPDLRRRPAAPREAPVVFLHIPKTAGTTATFWLMLLHGDRHMKAPATPRG
jgi:hypothetical protein